MDYSIEAITTIWVISLIIGAVVITVVGILLHQIRKTALKIDDGASQIWTQGKLVANNTIHIPTLLSTTNKVTEQILENAGAILDNAGQIVNHIDGCPGCPECVLKHN